MKKMVTQDLPELTGVAQCLDDQWAPQEVMVRAALEGVSHTKFQTDVDNRAKAEFMKSILLYESLVVNRAYLYSNPVIVQFYKGNSRERSNFEKLLSSGCIVPFLYDEDSADDKPTNIPVKDNVWQDWMSVCRDSEVHQLRLSWDRDMNRKKISHQLSMRFGQFARSLDRLSEHAFLSTFDLPTDKANLQLARNTLDNIVRDTTEFEISNKRAIKRQEIYSKYVCMEGTAPTDGIVDLKKPFALPIKQLFDLKYNLNLPDAIDKYVITAEDSISRSALQEIEMLTRGVESLTEDAFADILRIAVGTILDEIHRSFVPKSFSALTLGDIIAVRGDPIWLLHKGIVSKHLKTSRNFRDAKLFNDPENTVAEILSSTRNVFDLVHLKLDSRHRVEVSHSVEFWVHAISMGAKVGAKVVGHMTGVYVDIPPDAIELASRGACPIIVEIVLKFGHTETKLPLYSGKIDGESALVVISRFKEHMRERGLLTGEMSYTEGGGLEVRDEDA